MMIPKDLDKILKIVKNIISLKEVYLFGSYAYGTPNEASDFDLYFVVDKIDGDKYETIIKIRKAIYKITSKSVDILLNTKEMFDYRAINKSTLEYKILKEGVRLYG